MDENLTISFAELCDVRKDELQHILPGHQTKVSWQGFEKIIQNDDPYSRLYKRKRS